MHIKGINEEEAREIDKVLIEEDSFDAANVFVPGHFLILLYLVGIQPSGRLGQIQSHHQQSQTPVGHVMHH